MAPIALADEDLSLSTSKSIQSSPEHRVHSMTDKRPLAAMSHGPVPLRGIPTFVSFSTHRQWALSHMAAAFRHWATEGYVLGLSGHISVRDPEWSNAIWLNPLGKHFGLLRASDMVLVGLDDGKILAGIGNQSAPPNAAGYLIHAPIHRRRPDAHAVCHAHTKYGKAWSVFGKPLEMLNQDTCSNSHVCYNQYGGVVFAEEEGERIAECLGGAKGAILRNHGLLTVGGTVDEAAFLFLSMEKACESQILVEAAAASGGLQKVLVTDEEAEYNFKMESDPETLYCEFQVYYEYEYLRHQGDFTK